VLRHELAQVLDLDVGENREQRTEDRGQRSEVRSENRDNSEKRAILYMQYYDTIDAW
jgi:hypothetical protein